MSQSGGSRRGPRGLSRPESGSRGCYVLLLRGQRRRDSNCPGWRERSSLHCGCLNRGKSWRGPWRRPLLWRLCLSGIEVNRLWIGLCRGSSALCNINANPERTHNVHADQTRRRFKPNNDDKTGSSPSLTPLDIQMLGSPCYMKRFTVCTMHSNGKRLQSPPLGAVTPPNGKA